MIYKLKNKLYKPLSIDPKDLFEYALCVLVEKIYEKKIIVNNFKTHKQWTNIIFGIANEKNTSLLSRVTDRFNTYMIRMNSGYNLTFEKMYKWNFEKIFTEHRQLLDNYDSPDIILPLNNLISELIEAIEDEIHMSKEQTINNTYQILDLVTYPISNREEIYVATLNLEEDDEPKIFEGLPVKIQIGGLDYFDAKVLEYDNILQKVYFDCNDPLLRYSGNKYLIIDAVWLLEKIIENLNEYIDFDANKLPINKFFINRCEPIPTVVPNEIAYKIANLDDSQVNAINNAYNYDLSLIWGPPGTGKSTALGYLILKFLNLKERTLICCISNVAVDVITDKFAKLIESDNEIMRTLPRGSVLRVGYTKDIKLLDRDFLFPDSKKISEMRSKLRNLKINLQNQNLSKKEILGIKKEIEKVQYILKDAINSVIKNATIVFATASKVHSDGNFKELEYDNLIIDEASMMSVPHFVALAKNIKRRIIITGDFRQLGPVVLSQTAMSQKWLHKDIFQFAGLNTKLTTVFHNSMSQLLVQRRMHPNICSLINMYFYQGKLETNIKFDECQPILESHPFPNKVISYIDCRPEPKHIVISKKGSRYNLYTVDLISKIITKMLKSKVKSSIGVIAPYRRQVILHQNKLKELNFPSNIKDRVKIGTIHSFQGSETAIVIFDLVDSRHLKIGKLFQHDQGRRLINVALSRTKYKLVVVGDLELLVSGIGNTNVDSSIGAIAQKIIRYKVNIEN